MKKSSLKNPVTKADFYNLKKSTKDDIKNLGQKTDNAINQLRQELGKFATKDDLGKFATKDDLGKFATKDDLGKFATKDDLEDMAKRLYEHTEERFNQVREEMATKSDIQKVMYRIDEAIISNNAKTEELRKMWRNHETRISTLETAH